MHQIDSRSLLPPYGVPVAQTGLRESISERLRERDLKIVDQRMQILVLRMHQLASPYLSHPIFFNGGGPTYPPPLPAFLRHGQAFVSQSVKKKCERETRILAVDGCRFQQGFSSFER